MQCPCPTYCHLWPACLHQIIPHYLTPSTFHLPEHPPSPKKSYYTQMCVLIFSTHFIQKTSHSNKNSARYYHKCTYVFISTCDSCQILMKIEFHQQIFKKYSNINFHKNPSSGSQAVPSRWTDRPDEANNCFSQFCQHFQEC